jgi:membrane protease YdiL (CAAX protease family)
VSRGRWLALSLSAAILGVALELTAFRVRQLERAELEHESRWATLAELARAPFATRVSARLTTVALQAGEHALFELCARDTLEAARYGGAFELAVFRLPKLELMLRVPLDAAHLASAKRNSQGACLVLGSGPIERSGDYSLDAIWTGAPPSAVLQQVPFQARVLARRPLAASDRSYLIALALGAALGLLTLLTARQPSAPGATLDPQQRAPIQALAATRAPIQALMPFAALALLFGAIQVPTSGATATLCKGIGLVLLQVLVALGFARGSPQRRVSLALLPPRGIARASGLALISAALLVASAKLSLRLVPATGEAPIQSFIAWPSGMLCFAALGVVLPLGEEIFFRGYLYGAALRLGRAAAFVLALLAFVALHAQQSWGNWGGLAAIAVTGTVLTALRASSGSTLIPAIAHVLYNFALSVASF